MIKVFEDFDIALVGHYQSILESNGIATFMKNRFGTGGTGELPFVEVVPQLWVLNDDVEKLSRELINEVDKPGREPEGEKWVCRECGTVLEAVFTHCWKCSAARPDD